MSNTTNTTEPYAVFRKTTRTGKVRYYTFRSRFRLVVMSRKVAEFDLASGAAVNAGKPWSAAADDESWG